MMCMAFLLRPILDAFSLTLNPFKPGLARVSRRHQRYDTGPRTLIFTVIRTGGADAFDVNFSTVDGTATVADGDYVQNSGTLHFADGINTQTISIVINGDTKVEANETFGVQLSNVTNGA